MKKVLLFACLFLFIKNSIAQNVGIGTTTPDAAAILEIASANKGILIPRVTLTGINDISTIVGVTRSLLVYNTVTAGVGNLAVQSGFYYWAGITWARMLADDGTAKAAWLTGGNNGTLPSTNFIGTLDGQSFQFKINNTNAGYLGLGGNTYWGLNSGNINSTGFSNVAIGSAALSQTTNRSNLVAVGDSALLNNGTGATLPAEANNNTAIGSKSLLTNTKGNDNTAVGFQTLKANTTGIYNTAVGSKAMLVNTTGNSNTSTGTFSLFSNTTGSNNVADGYRALLSNSTGVGNVAIGMSSLFQSQSASNTVAIGDSALYNFDGGNTGVSLLFAGNTAVGSKALFSTTTGNTNTAIGGKAMYANSIGNFNVAVGNKSLFSNSNGSGNVAVGLSALSQNLTGNQNVAMGYGALTTANASNNIAIGSSALLLNTFGSHNVAIGSSALYSNIGESGLVAIGDSALYSSTGKENSAIGSKSLYSNTNGQFNTATGKESLYSNTTGDANTSNGYKALYSNVNGDGNTAIGTSTLTDHRIGDFNTALGSDALHKDSSGYYNTATGFNALSSNISGFENTANGVGALISNLSGNSNTAIGITALSKLTRGDNNTALGVYALWNATLVNKNTAIGYFADAPSTLSTNATAIGANAIANCSNCMVLGSVPGLNGGTANINVGIGTNTPQTDLHINPNGSGSILVGKNKTSGGYTNLEMGISAQSGGYSYINSIKASGSTSGDLILNQNGGNIGVGVNVPQTDLHINPNGAGSILIGTNKSSGGYTNLEMGITSQSGGKAYIQSTNVSGTSYGDMHLNPGGGYVGINLPTATTAFAPLDIKQTSINRGLRLRNNYNSNGWDLAANGTLDFYDNGLLVLQIGQDGSYNQISDQRLKTNVVKMETVLEKVMTLKPSKYEYLNNNPTHKISTGFLAQEVMPIFPDLVADFKHPDGDTTDNTVYHTINYAGFSVIAIKAIQEQQQQIEIANKKNNDMMVLLEKMQLEIEVLKQKIK